MNSLIRRAMTSLRVRPATNAFFFGDKKPGKEGKKPAEKKPAEKNPADKDKKPADKKPAEKK